MVSSLSPHCLHLLFCCILSILVLIWLVPTALFCAAIRRYSVSLLMFPFLSHVQVLSSEMLLISRLKRPESCFPSNFCFLVVVILLSIVLSVSFLMAVISPPSCLLLSLLLSTPKEFFTSVLADGLSLEFERHQFFSSLQDSSRYSGRYQYCCSLDGLQSFSKFQVLQSVQ